MVLNVVLSPSISFLSSLLILDDAPSSNMIERVQDIYMSVLESEECIERIVCEIGGLAEDAGFSKKMTK